MSRIRSAAWRRRTRLNPQIAADPILFREKGETGFDGQNQVAADAASLRICWKRLMLNGIEAR